MELWKLEKRPDWAVIASSVQCPICGADVADSCHPMGYPKQVRLDWHAERKIKAAEAFLSFTEVKSDAT